MPLIGHLARTAALAAPFFLFSAQPLAQPPQPSSQSLLQAALEGQELAAGKDVAAGTRVKSSVTGLGFKLPEGLSASFSPAGNALLLKGSGKWGVVVARTGMSADEISAMFTEEMDLTSMHDDAWAERVGAPKVDGKKVSATYEGDEVYGTARGQVGADGQGFAVLVLARSKAGAAADVAAIMDSLAWAAPQHEKARMHWLGLLENQRLSITEGSESLNVDLRKDGTYTLVYKAESVYREAGKWRIEIGPACGNLVMSPDGGTTKSLYLAAEGDKVIVDGAKYTRAPLDGSRPAEGGTAKTEPRPAEADDKGKARKVEDDPNWKTDQKEVDKLDGTELTFGVGHEGGKRLKTDFLGLSFVVPAGVKGAGDGKAPMFLMRPDDQRGLGLVVMQTGMTAASGAAFLHDDMDLSSIEQGVVLKPQGQARVEGGRITQDYGNETYTARAVMVIGPSANALGVTFVGARGDREKLHGYVDAVVKSVQFAKPQAETRRAELSKQLHGKCLHIYRYKQSGSGANSSSWETKIWYHFGSDGSYFYQYKFVSDHYVKGTDGGGNDTFRGGAAQDNYREEKGNWSIEFNMTGVALVLKAENGTQVTHQLRVEASKVFMNEEEVTVGNSDKKR